MIPCPPVTAPADPHRVRRLDELAPREGLRRQDHHDLVRLMDLLAGLPHPPDPAGAFPRYAELHARYLRALDEGEAEAVEESFLELYAHLHLHEAPYTADERRRMDAAGGYWCHAGGISPVVRAGRHLRPASVSADLGAGNGLQLLLLQRLHPHALSVQVEISSGAVTLGRELQRWLEIPEASVRWVVADVLAAPIPDADLLYLYRPVRPEGPGRAFYERLAAHLASRRTETVVFSIADCLRDFLDDRFEVTHSDGHLTCFRGPLSAREPPIVSSDDRRKSDQG